MKVRAETGFSKDVIRYLRQGGREISFSEGEIIIKRGDRGKSFYVILSGVIEVGMTGEEDRYFPLARMGKGDSFGEMALIRGLPASADIIALGDVTVLEYPAEEFREALAKSEGFRNQLMTRMAQNLHDTSAEAWASFQRADTLNMLVHKDIPQSEPLVAKSTKMRKIEKEIIRVSQFQDPRPVLITGEPGTGKVFTAMKIHNLSAASSAPFLIVDCLRLDEIEASTLLFGTSQLNDTTRGGRFKGFGILHLAHGGTLVLKHIDALDKLSQEFLSNYLKMMDLSRGKGFPCVRIIATTREKAAELPESKEFLERLLAQLSAHTLKIPPLRERKADILPLARIFLDKAGDRNRQDARPGDISKSAAHDLLALRYRHNNVKELRETVELAALFAENGEVLPEHLFSGPKDKGLPPEFDLNEISFIRRLVRGKSRVLGLLQAGTLLMFSAIILAGLLWSDNKIGQTANSLIWGVWEPLLIFSFLFIGHVWCMICPLSTLGRLFQRVGSLKRPTSRWIKKYGVWLAVLGFFLIVWTERIFHMTTYPRASGILLLTLIAAAVLCGIVYQREVWCRYICPLGALASGFSFPGMLHVRARPHICATYCTTHECYKGTPETGGCPVFHHPLYISDGHNCKLCFKCLRICPHDSTRFYFRPFLQSVWLFGGFARLLAPFALAVFSLSIVLLASNESTWLKGPVEMTAAALVSVFLGILLHISLPRLLSGKTDPDTTVSSRAAFALMVLAWGPLMAYQLTNIPGLSSLRLAAASGSMAENIFPFKGVTLLVVLQLAAVLFAALLTAVAFWRIRVQAEKEEIKLNKTGWRALLILCTIYVLFAVTVTVL